MLIRALIVLLLVLNLGVALWWISRPPSSPEPPVEPAPGVARLQLVSEAGPAQATPPTAGAEAVISQCVSFGPFADPARATQARSELQSPGVQLQLRREYAGTVSSWKVFLPPFASMDEAEAAAERIAAAGFKDYFLVRDGDDARSVALGLYRSEAAAREHATKLVAAGFRAELAPHGAGPATHWLDVGAGLDPADAQSRIGAERVEPIDCARFAPARSAAAR